MTGIAVAMIGHLKRKLRPNFYSHLVRPKTVSHELVIIASQVAHRPHFRDSEPQKLHQKLLIEIALETVAHKLVMICCPYTSLQRQWHTHW